MAQPEKLKIEFPPGWFSLGERLTGIRANELERMVKAGELEKIPQSDIERPNDRAHRAERRGVFHARGIPAEHVANVYDREPLANQALEAVKDFISDTAQLVLVLRGGVGIGKSGAAAWVLTKLPGKFVSAQQFVRATITRTDDDKAHLLALFRAQILVIDDLGREDVDRRGYGASKLAELIEARYNERQRMIITTNLTPALMAERYGVRAIDRLQQHWRFVDAVGDSLRIGGSSVRGAP